MDMQRGDERIIAHLGFARAVASRALHPRCHGAGTVKTLPPGACLVWCRPPRRYRDDICALSGAYAARRVRGQVLDALRERDPLTRSARRAYRVARELDADLPPPIVEVSLDRCLVAGLEGAD